MASGEPKDHDVFARNDNVHGLLSGSAYRFVALKVR